MSFFTSLKDFILTSPTSFHAADTIEKKLIIHGFKEYGFNEPLPKGAKIFFKEGGMIAAFFLPTTLKRCKYLLAHTDSPALKLKPQPLKQALGLNFLVAEPYGSPLLSSYLGKPLSVAGVVHIENGSKLEVKKIHDSAPLYIVDPAIHLSKEANAALNKGQLHALISEGPAPTLESLLNVHGKILAHDLYLTSSTPLNCFGPTGELIAGPRLDNLSSCFALLETLLNTHTPPDTLLGALFFDHEEIGSQTLEGARSHFIKKRLKHIIKSYDFTGLIDTLSQAYSLDVAHANHPNFPDKFDESHTIELGKGVVLKHHSAHKYAQNLSLFAQAKKMKLPTQTFTMRNEVGTGSTLGPYFTTLYGIPTQDVGIPLLGMHSTTEIIAEKDLASLITFCKEFFYGG